MLITGNIGGMKKVVFGMLVLWLALMSVGAAAHAVPKASQATGIGHQHESSINQAQATNAGDVVTANASHADTCDQTHCGHGHVSGILTPYGARFDACTSTALPASRASWATSLIATDIERPKWLFTTPAVVSLPG